MHVFLTGERHVGKSWAVREITRRLALPVQGFVTDFKPGEHGMELFMMPADQPACMDEVHLVALRTEGKMCAVEGRFEQVGVPMLAEAQRHGEALILMDECGHLEKHAPVFQQAIVRCLDGRIPVLGVLRKDQDWHEVIKRHPHVRVLEVTEENREQIVDEAVALLREELPKGRMLIEELVPWTLNGEPQSALLCSPQEVDALITGLLYTSGRVTNAEQQLRVNRGDDGVWHAEALSPAPRKPLEHRLGDLSVCKSDLCISYARAGELIEQLMAIDNSNGQHTVVLTCGETQFVCRDIGRHNALDKAIGQALLHGYPLNDCVVCTSGRVNIEIMAKIAAAGLPVIITKKQVGNLAEQTASLCNVTAMQFGKQPCVYGAQWRVTDMPE